jgi:hypothetical protein
MNTEVRPVESRGEQALAFLIADGVGADRKLTHLQR